MADPAYDARVLLKRIERFPKVLEINARVGLKDAGANFNRVFDKVFTAALEGPFRQNTTRDRLANRTGALKGSFRQKVVRASGGAARAANLDLRCTVGDATTKDYVRVQEFGAVGPNAIRPKRGKYLTIPMPDNLTPTGRVRVKSITSVGGSAVWFKKNGNLYAGRQFADGTLRVLFVLKKKVEIPPRLNFRTKWGSKKVRQFNEQRIEKAVQTALRQAKLA